MSDQGGNTTRALRSPVRDVDVPVGRTFLALPAEDNHIVQFYDDDDFLCDTVAHFLGAGLVEAEPVLVIATAAHIEAVRARLSDRSIDVARACASGQLTLLDAAETLARFMRDGQPDATLFHAIVGGALDAIAARCGPARVRAFGEMVDLLWRQGNGPAAQQLETLWNDLGAARPISLLCAYAMENFRDDAGGARFGDVCATHSHVLPTEQYGQLSDDDARLREVGRLQQRAKTLDAEVARRKQVERSLAESQAGRKRTELERTSLLMQAPVAAAILIGPEHRFELANSAYCAMVGRDVVGKAYVEAFPELVGTPQPGILDRVYQTGEPFVTHEALLPLARQPGGQVEDAYFKFNLEPLRDDAGRVYGMMAVAVEVTEQVRARRELEATEQHLRTLIDSIPTLAWTARADGWIDFYNQRWYEYTGTTAAEMEGWGWQSVHHPDHLASVMERWSASIHTGQPFDMPFPLRRADGVFRWHLTRVIPLRDPAGNIVRWFGTNTDIDDQLRTEKELAEANRANETLHRIGQALNAELNLSRLVQTLTDEATALCHAQFGAFFYNVLDAEGESYMLYALAGVEREAFAHLPMPRNTAVFGPTFRGEGPVRLDDVTRDARFGKSAPYHGLPAGHPPVRSYLAVPVVSRSGAVLGGLFFGHARPGVFSARDEQLIVAVAAQAAIAIDNARLYDAERRARERAERSQQRSARLHAVTAAMSGVISAEEASRIVIRETLLALGAAAGGVLLLDGSGAGTEQLIVGGDVSPDMVGDAQRLALAGPLPIHDALRTGKLVWVPSEAEIARRYPHLVEHARQTGARAWGAIPLIFEGRTIGSLGFRLTDERALDGEDEDFLLAVGQQCGMAVERARLYEEARVARAVAEDASQAKDEFLAMLGHELRNPLSPIVTALHLMKLRGDSKSTREQNVIQRQVQHLVRLVDDLLDISKITRGKVELSRRPVELSAIVAKAVEMASPLFEERGHHVTVSVAHEGLSLEGDEMRLAQVIANLLTNAAKYTERGGSISIVAAHEGDQIVVRVKDNGVGIPAELLPRVFDLFVQGPRASDRGQGGLGIGLALVRNLVTLHGGSVQATSDGEGRGSEFVVRLPALARARVAALRSPAETRREAPMCATARRVLIVDDNQDAAELLAQLLQAVGHHVMVAHDGPQALAMLDHFTPDVAVLDIGLPVMDGYELAARICERLAPSRPRLMAVTGYGQDHDRARSLQAGFEIHFVKPLAAEKLLAAIDGEPARPSPAN